jgi:hypothetical protein
MPDQNDLNKPDLGSSYNNEVLETLRGHIARLWTGTWGSMAGVINGMLRWEIPGGNVLRLWRRNGSGTDDLVFDSTSLLGDGTVTTAKLANGAVTPSKLADGAVTPSKLADASVTTVKLAPVIAPVVSSLNGGQLAGMRNKIINGAMAIDQRNNGALVSITTGSALAYTVDRWFVWVTGTGNIAGVQRVSGTSPNEFLLQIGNGGSGRTVRVAQRIEASDSQDLAGMVATLSADLARTPTGGTVVTWTASYANTRDSFGTVAAPTKTQIATGTFTVSSTVTRYSTQISIPSAAITGIEIEFSWQTGTVVSDSVIGRVQLEPGSVATPFEHRPIGAELALCQRYYWRLSGTTTQQIAMGWCETTTRCRPFIKTPATMRTTPSANSSTITSFFLRGGGTNVAVSSSLGGWFGTTQDTIHNELNTATAHGGAAGGAAVLCTPASSWFIDASAEL